MGEFFLISWKQKSNKQATFLTKIWGSKNQKDKSGTQNFSDLRTFINLGKNSSQQICPFGDVEAQGPKFGTDKPSPNFVPQNLKLKTQWYIFT
jgi:hypothetical protein